MTNFVELTLNQVEIVAAGSCNCICCVVSAGAGGLGDYGPGFTNLYCAPQSVGQVPDEDACEEICTTIHSSFPNDNWERDRSVHLGGGSGALHAHAEFVGCY